MLPHFYGARLFFYSVISTVLPHFHGAPLFFYSVISTVLPHFHGAPLLSILHSPYLQSIHNFLYCSLIFCKALSFLAEILSAPWQSFCCWSWGCCRNWQCKISPCKICRAGNSLFGFLSESLVFCKGKSEKAIRSWKRANHFCCSFVKSDGSDSLLGIKRRSNEKLSKTWWKIHIFSSEWLVFWEQQEQFAHGRSFLNRNGSELLTVALQKDQFWAKERIPNPKNMVLCKYSTYLHFGNCVRDTLWRTRCRERGQKIPDTKEI